MTHSINFKKLLALLMTLVMVMCVFAGCGNKEEEYYSYYEYYEEDDTASDDTQSDDGSTDSNDDGNTTTSSKDEGGSTTEVPKNLRGTTVKMLFWRPLMDAEQKAIDKFEKETGIKVEVKNTPNAGTYGELISSSLAAKEGYDIAMFNNTDFPGRPVQYFQPLNDIKGFDFKDSAWDISVMDTQKINGKYYGVSVNGSLNSEYICMFFNETKFKDRGVKTPREYWEEGNWNWDTFLECAKAMTYEDNGVQVYGYLNRGSSYITYWTQAAGTDFINYDGSKFTANLSDTKLIDTLKFYNDLGHKYKVGDPENTYGVPDFRTGNAAMFSCITYPMRKDSDTKFNQMTDTIDAVPFPMPKGEKEVALIDSTLFGILKGAKNEEGAAVFLRYFLDPANYDMSSYFINKNLESTFNALSKMEKRVSITQGVVNYAAQVDFGNVCHNIALTTADQTSAKLQSYKSNFEVAVQKANKAIED
ncbi:MAG: extracellular solute-binding protein [Clostridia bacterium]|nr:extracellular solute-binding protein [Clostridia bacterium]